MGCPGSSLPRWEKMNASCSDSHQLESSSLRPALFNIGLRLFSSLSFSFLSIALLFSLSGPFLVAGCGAV